MKILLAFAVVLVKMTAHSQELSINVSLDICLLRACGPTLGPFSIFCSAVCELGGFNSSECNYASGLGECLCKGSGDSTLLLGTMCDVLCTEGCQTCGFNTGSCSTPLGPAESVACNCL